MSITRLSDEEILQAAQRILDLKIEAARQQDWSLYSQNMLPAHISLEHQTEVEQRWREQDVVCSLTPYRQLLGIFRLENRVSVSWRLKSSATEGDVLATLWLAMDDGDIKDSGYHIITNTIA